MKAFFGYEVSFTPIFEKMRIERRIFLFIALTSLFKKSERKEKTSFFLSSLKIPGYLCTANSEGWQVCGDPAIAPNWCSRREASALLCEKKGALILFEGSAPFFLLLRLLGIHLGMWRTGANQT